MIVLLDCPKYQWKISSPKKCAQKTKEGQELKQAAKTQRYGTLQPLLTRRKALV